MLVNDYALGRFAGFGSTNPADGSNCGQPSWGLLGPPRDVLARWCDCTYPAHLGDKFPMWNSRCKAAAVAPWTTLGKQIIGLPDDSLLGQLATQLTSAVKPAIQNIVAPVAPAAEAPPPPVVPAAPSTTSSFFTTATGGSTFFPTTAGGKTGLAIAAAAGIGLVALLYLKKK